MLRRGISRSGQGVESLKMGISLWKMGFQARSRGWEPNPSWRDLDAYPSLAIGDVIWIGTQGRGVVFGNLGLSVGDTPQTQHQESHSDTGRLASSCDLAGHLQTPDNHYKAP